MTEKIKKLPYGYKWFHGGVMSDALTDSYNYTHSKIQEIEKSGFNKDQLEALRNTAHMMVMAVMPDLTGANAGK